MKKNDKKFVLITGAALAAFSAGAVHAAEVAKVKDMSGSTLIAGEEGDKSCGSEGCSSSDQKKAKGDKSCSGDKSCGAEKKHSKKKKEKTETQSGQGED